MILMLLLPKRGLLRWPNIGWSSWIMSFLWHQPALFVGSTPNLSETRCWLNHPSRKCSIHLKHSQTSYVDLNNLTPPTSKLLLQTQPIAPRLPCESSCGSALLPPCRWGICRKRPGRSQPRKTKRVKKIENLILRAWSGRIWNFVLFKVI